MVTASGSSGDGINRTVQYATWRKDQQRQDGYSHELISNRVEAQYYDSLDQQPSQQYGARTLLQMFKDNVAENPGMPFLGTRQLISEYSKTGAKQPQFGQY